MQSELANLELVVIAAYLVGADKHRVDTEDVAVKANEIAPGRFSWRKYPEQINIDTVRKRLWDACRSDKGGYLRGSEKEGWILTQSGLKFAKAKTKNLKTTPKRRLTIADRRWIRTEKCRLLASDAHLKFASGHPEEITHSEALGFFRIDSYVDSQTRKDKIQRVVNAFDTDKQLGPTIHTVIAILREDMR